MPKFEYQEQFTRLPVSTYLIEHQVHAEVGGVGSMTVSIAAQGPGDCASHILYIVHVDVGNGRVRVCPSARDWPFTFAAFSLYLTWTFLYGHAKN